MKLQSEWQQLFKRLDDNTTVLTPNQRLVAYLLSQYQLFQQQQNKTVWETPNIIAFSNWQQLCWEQCEQTNQTDSKLLLNDSQTLLLWEQIIAADNEALLQIALTATHARSAWRLLKEWNTPLDQIKTFSNNSVETFYQWAQTFEKQCTQKNWLDADSLLDQIIDKISQNHLDFSNQKFMLVGFDDLSPRFNKLLEVLGQSLCSFERFSSHRQAQASQITTPDLEHEISVMANWARRRLDEDKNINIACVALNLSQQRNQIERGFKKVFDNHDTFNISVGLPLTDYPMINTAFHVLSLNFKTIPLSSIFHLLRSPFVKDADDEMQQRALLDNQLSQLDLIDLNIDELIEQLKLFENCPELLTLIEHFKENINTKPMAPHEWAKHFSKQLHDFGWPGDRSLSSPEFQTVERWHTLLSEFAHLQCVTGTVPYTQAIHLLKALANKAIFQPQSKQFSVPVLGLLEAAGMIFDEVWIMGLDEQSWPQTASPNPFLPIPLQRELQMPHADNERELSFSQTFMQRFMISTDKLHLSYSKQSEQHECLASPLIKDFPLEEFEQPVCELETIELEHLIDNKGPALPVDASTKGGTQLFKLQAACPFQAYATLRLNAEPRPTTEFGLTAQIRGIILHATLEKFWLEVKDQESLQALEPEKQIELLSSTIDKVLNKLHLQFLLKHPLYKKTEKQRLLFLLENWLAQEKQRPNFRIKSIEKSQQVTFANFILNLRIDRIDELESGQFLMIDYKSGQTSIQDWFGDRINEPQLPLYCLTQKQNISSIAFVQFKPDAITIKGVAADDLETDGIKTSQKANDIAWNDLLVQWHSDLTQTADDYKNGLASLDPKYGTQTCQYCCLQGLCRIAS